MQNIGILDIKGENNNPLNNEPYTDIYKKLAEVWSKFPAYEMANDIIKDISEHQVILIESSTGSGKTVLIPKYALHTLNYNGKIAITLPKQVTAKSAAEFAAVTLDVQLGKQVGYQYKGSDKSMRSNKNNLLYATDGTIVAKLMRDPELKDFDIVIVDEAHERKVQIDFLLFLLKQTLMLRPTFKVIIMSATINADIFKDYYSQFKFKSINIGGKTNYPIESIFLREQLKYTQAIEKGFDILIKILESDEIDEDEKAHDVIFFVVSSNEAFKLCKQLHTYIDSKCKNSKSNMICENGTFCVEFYSGVNKDKEELVANKNLYKKKGNFKRKVVISTPVAESSITIDGLKYVIDSGYEFKGSYDPIMRAKRLDRKLITLAQAKQRMGRSGRTEPGICYHLYTKDDFEHHMEKYPDPDIRNSDISEECLKLLNIEQIGNVNNLMDILTQFIEPPREPYIKDAITILMQYGLVTNSNITNLGRLVSSIGEINMGISIIYGKLYNCSHELIKIHSVIDIIKKNLASIFILPNTLVKRKNGEGNGEYNRRLKEVVEKYDRAREKFRHKYGDHLSLLRLFDKFDKYSRKNPDDYKKISQWCKDRFVKIDMMLKIKNNVRHFEQNFRDTLKEVSPEFLGITLDDKILQLEVSKRIIKCLEFGHKANIAFKNEKDFYKSRYASNIIVNVDENSFLLMTSVRPKKIIYSELFISMGKANFNIVSKLVS